VTNLTDHDPGSLRDAIATTLPGGTVDFQPGLSGTISLTTATLSIAHDVTIVGPGQGVITVSGSSTFRVFNISSGLSVTLSGLTIGGGAVTNDDGGGIWNAGSLVVNGCTINSNTSTNGKGGRHL
jgi:hypothetical protein